MSLWRWHNMAVPLWHCGGASLQTSGFTLPSKITTSRLQIVTLFCQESADSCWCYAWCVIWGFLILLFYGWVGMRYGTKLWVRGFVGIRSYHEGSIFAIATYLSQGLLIPAFDVKILWFFVVATFGVWRPDGFFRKYNFRLWGPLHFLCNDIVQL